MLCRHRKNDVCFLVQQLSVRPFSYLDSKHTVKIDVLYFGMQSVLLQYDGISTTYSSFTAQNMRFM